MINYAHLKVLLAKDFLTLKRNSGFIVAFCLLPIALMSAFKAIQGLVDGGTRQGSLLKENFFYTSTKFFEFENDDDETITSNLPFADVAPYTRDVGEYGTKYSSSLQGCTRENRNKYYYDKIMIVAESQELREDLAIYLEQYVMKANGFPNNWTVEGYAKQEDAFLEYADADKTPFCFGLTFNKFDEVNNDYDIEFHWSKEQLPDTNLPAFSEQIKAPDLRNWQRWKDTGALSLYPYITEFIARRKKNHALNAKKPLYEQQMGYSPLRSRPHLATSPRGLDQLVQNFPFFFMIILLIPFYYLVSKLASEKESKAREGMKMMGLNDSTYYAGWFVFYSFICFVTSVFVTLMAKSIFVNVAMDVFFIWSMTYGCSLYGIAFMIVAFLPSKKSSGVAATLFHMMTFYSYAAVSDPAIPSSTQYQASIFPNINMYKCVNQIFFYNYQTKDGLTWDTMGSEYQNFTFKGGLQMMIFDIIFWAAIGLYLDQVVPSQFGVAKPWYFCCSCKKNNSVRNKNSDQENPDKKQLNFEAVSDALKRQEVNEQCLQMKGLVKTFGTKRAVDGTELKFYNGQIFALLGHNGAGKTTTISMLTGLLEPTEGYATVNGIDIFNDMTNFRKELGVCPQHDVLFEFLTPIDHLRLFASFKGTPPELVEAQVQKMLEDIELTTVKDQESRTLSGGQKRKLSVAIAMIGDSKIVMLDEPTSGMDTSARRKLWEMLKRNKQGKIIILTTHYMDEADILGDRIAIMAEGKVICTGSSLFLKNRFGVGYNLVIAKKTRDEAPQIDKFVMERIDNVKKLQEVSSEISYQLPSSSSKQFKSFFQEFDSSLDSLGIRSYGVGITTLEEVFLKIGHGEDVDEGTEEIKDSEGVEKTKPGTPEESKSTIDQALIDEIEDYSIGNNKESAPFLPQFCAVLRKKILMQTRDKKTLCIDSIFPVILILAGLALSTLSIFKNGQVRHLTPFLYQDQWNVIYNQNSGVLSAEDDKIKGFVEDFLKPINSTGINIQQSIQIVPKPKIFDESSQLDYFVYDTVNRLDAPASFGQFFIYDLNLDKTSPFGTSYQGVMFLNATSQEIPAAYGFYGHLAFLRHFLKMEKDEPMNLKMSYRPFPISKALESLNKTIAGTNSAVLLSIAWLMISDSLLQGIIKERQRYVKHQMMISGCSLKAYWLGNYFGDVLFHGIAVVAGNIGVQMFGVDLPGIGSLLIAMMFANPAFIYFFSFFFEKDETGSLAMKLSSFVFGLIAPIAISVLSVIDEDTAEVANVCKWFCFPFPIFSIAFGFMSIAQRDIIALRNDLDEADPLSPQVAGWSYRFLIGAVPFYWFWVVCFENKIFDYLLCRKGAKVEIESNEYAVKLKQAEDAIQDQDVILERERVRLKKPDELPVRVCEVEKNYDQVKAVRNLSFGLEYGECFALLGVSGAGKTSIFKCLTGEVYPTTGQLTINGFDVTTNKGFQEARKQIGYCPQFDAIYDGLSVKEHLQIYAALKGIKPKLIAPIIELALKDMDLRDYTNIHANNLSGGNKRKLSVALAMLGNPPLVFLDEPSTGVDPQAKRFMWNVVSKISTQRKKSAVIITTHSMEEAEALCTKMGIMVDGQFKCFGSSQLIKDKYGTGYEIEFKIRTLTDDETQQNLDDHGLGDQTLLSKEQAMKYLHDAGYSLLESQISEFGLGCDYDAKFKDDQKVNSFEFARWLFTEGKGEMANQFLKPKFEEFSIFEHYGSSWKIRVSRDSYSIGFLFGLMEDIQTDYEISEYSVTQTTLEQIFNNFAQTSESVQEAAEEKNDRRDKNRDQKQESQEKLLDNRRDEESSDPPKTSTQDLAVNS